MIDTNKINLIREKCIAANPEIDQQSEWKPDEWADGGFLPVARPVRLADILLAIEKKSNHPNTEYFVLSNGLFGVGAFLGTRGNITNLAKENKGGRFWNLRADDRQSEETINFLAELLK